MFGSVSNIEYIDNGFLVTSNEEAAGPVWGAVVVIAKAIAPVVVAAAKGALVGSIVSAGIAYAGGARGSDVWRAAGLGAIGGGITGGLGAIASGGAGGAASGGAASATTPAATTAAAPGTFSATLGSGTIPQLTSTTGIAGTTTVASPSIMSSLSSMFSGANGQMLSRVGAALVNAAVNGQSMGRMDGLVAQQRAELAQLAATNQAAYQQRIATAQQILDDANKMDPNWYARLAMVDASAIEMNQFREAMRNIATRQGGSLDQGQRKAYQRGAALHTARTKALSYNRAYVDAKGQQNQLRANAANLFGPDEMGFRIWDADTNLRADQERARQELNQSTWGGLTGAFTEPNYRPSTSPDPSAEDDEEGSNGFTTGMFAPFGRE